MTRPPARPYEQRFIDAAPGVRLWADATGDRDATALLLIMGANASGFAWPEALVARLAARHRVLRYDHRDTGRSTRAFAEHPYPILDLAGDALAVLDGFGADIAIDPPVAGAAELPGPSEEVLAMWQHLGEPRDRAAEVAFNVEHWRLLSGVERGGEFEESEFRALEERIRHHAGHDDPTVAHSLADASNLARGAALAGVRTPTLVIEAPLDPVFPPPHAAHLASLIPGARLVTIPRMGHALPSAVLAELADAILTHTAEADPSCRS